MGTLRQDIRYALRNLAKGPGFAIVAVVTLALGIGASTAIFSVIDNVLMEPFPYTDAQRLMSVQIHDTEQNEPGGRAAYSGPEFIDYVEQNHVFDRVMSNAGEDVLYRSGEGTERFSGNLVTPGTLEGLGMPALVGRTLQPADYEPGMPPVFVMRYKSWHWTGSQPRDRARHCNAAVGRVGLRPRDACVRGCVAFAHRRDRLLDSRAASIARRSAGRAALRVTVFVGTRSLTSEFAA